MDQYISKEILDKFLQQLLWEKQITDNAGNIIEIIRIKVRLHFIVKCLLLVLKMFQKNLTWRYVGISL